MNIVSKTSVICYWDTQSYPQSWFSIFSILSLQARWTLKINLDYMCILSLNCQEKKKHTPSATVNALCLFNALQVLRELNVLKFGLWMDSYISLSQNILTVVVKMKINEPHDDGSL